MEILLFLITAAISFLGSVQLGSVNLAVVQTTLSRNLKAGLLVAIGGCLPEIIYSVLALEGLAFVQRHQSMADALNLLLIPVFVVMGLITYFQKPAAPKPSSGFSGTMHLLKGFLLGMLNPQLLPFWFFISVYISKYISIQSTSAHIAFVAGAAVGALCILCLFARISHRQQHRIEKWLRGYPIHKVTGLIFIALGIIQAARLLADF